MYNPVGSAIILPALEHDPDGEIFASFLSGRQLGAAIGLKS
jgi:hypothetical protein